MESLRHYEELNTARAERAHELKRLVAQLFAVLRPAARPQPSPPQATPHA